MGRAVIRRSRFSELIKRLNKRSFRCKSDSRSYNKVIKQLEFISRFSGVYGIVIIINKQNRKIQIKKIKQEEDAEERFFSWPIAWLQGEEIGSGEEEVEEVVLGKTKKEDQQEIEGGAA
jgi:hypothetical protein